MLFHIIRYDWLALRASRQLPAALGLLAFFVGVALWNGQRHVAFQRRTLAAIQRADSLNYSRLTAATRRLEAGEPFTGNAWENPQDAFRAGTRLASHYATLPPAPLALLAVGQSDLLPTYYKPTIGKLTTLFHPTEIASAEALYDGSFDLAFVLVYLVPLLTIALSYNLVSAEREQGTLALLLTSSAAPRQLVLGKYLFRWLLLNAWLAALVLAVLPLAHVPLGAVEGELLFLLLLALGYSGFWFALAFWVNSCGYDSGTNAAALVGAWLVLVLLVPALLGNLAEALYPMPARVALTTRTREAAAEAKTTGSRLLAKYFEDHPELAPKATGATGGPQEFAQTALRTQLAVAAAVRPLEADFKRQHQRQQDLLARFCLLSPAVVVQRGLATVAGTDAARYAGFQTQVAAYAQRFEQFFVGKVFRQEHMRAADYALVPTWQYQPPASPLDSASGLLPVVWLLASMALLTGLGVASWHRLQPGCF